MNNKLTNFVEEYQDVYKYRNQDILFDLIDEIQNIIEFTFALEVNKSKIKPKLILGENEEDIDTAKTQKYIGPMVFINLHKRSSAASSLGDPEQLKYSTFKNNLVSGVPKFYETLTLKDGRKVNKSVMYYDNEFYLTVVTKTLKEAMELIPLIERGLNINSRAIMPNFIEVAGITNIEVLEKKDTDKTIRTKITYQVRSKEIVIIDKSYILKGYQIHSKDITFKSGSIINGTWLDNKPDGKFEEFPESYIGGIDE